MAAIAERVALTEVLTRRTSAGHWSNAWYRVRRDRLTLVSAAVDGTASATRGWLHVVWHEMQDVYADAIGQSGVVAEVEGNDAAASATPFTLGQELDGALASAADQDWWSFSGQAGRFARRDSLHIVCPERTTDWFRERVC